MERQLGKMKLEIGKMKLETGNLKFGKTESCKCFI
jgi:hypothetical protein